ncbi:adenylate/guanylate cyclase domain-containing protein [Nocardioides mangrovi]|uniref:AAA family ATPase n=1 Tax=Nocardioides mangrovi TaxID=2874580 RepID=A0ABS7UHX5_9ACTN|nr:adenylate/guanylate cyclase domain-containing protein [Nocardioides mangrovi]MBZ5740271.1 AAA family ATPase [Nocardioides mangrovi]
MVCASCGEALPANAKFCLECGTPVAADSGREVRKTVTLLFTDVTGSTAMGESLDPEAYRGVMGRYFDVAREAVERHGGTVEKFVGDAVLAVFGVPEVREDDALRAVRAAHELNAAVAELSTELQASHGVALTIRTGVNTGSVVAGTARAGGSFATGDAVNTAARLEQAAGAGEVLLGEQTWQLVRDAVDAEPVAPVEAKGKSEPVPAYRLLTIRDADAGRSRRLDDPLVGRDRETRALDDALERTLASGRSHLVTVVGAPGIGKTRLVGEFVARVGDRADVVSGRCLSYGQGITYYPIVGVIRSALRLGGTESDEVVRHALTRAMAEATDADGVADTLLPLLGGGGEPRGHDDTFWAVRRLLEQLAQRRPLVVTVDDLHWAEPTLLELLEQVREEVADLPLLLICGARPELLEEHPEWGHGSLDSLTFGLDPFGAAEVRDRVETILAGPAPDELVATVTEWSGGNPLFVEEIVAHLVEEGHLRFTDRWETTGDIGRVRVPPTVSALLAARLDRLPSDERDLLGRVSVIGQSFIAAEAVELLDPDQRPATAALLTQLARRDLLRRVRDGAGDAWAFRHITIRDTAYDALPKALRAELHERFADAVASAAAAGETGAERSAFVAHHLAEALRLRTELAAHDAALAPLRARTAVALGRAGLDAQDRDDPDAATALLHQAAAVRHPDPAVRRDLLLDLITVQLAVSRAREASETLAELDRETEGVAPLDLATRDACALIIDLSVSDEIDPVRAIEVGERLEGMARDAGDDRRALVGLITLSTAYSMAALWSPAMTVAERLLASGSPASVRLGHLQRGGAALHGSTPLSRLRDYYPVRTDSPTGRYWSAMIEAIGMAGPLPEEAGPAIAVATLRSEEAGELATFLVGTSYARHLVGDLDGAIDHYGRAVEKLFADGEGAIASTYIGERSMVRLLRGDDVDEIAQEQVVAHRHTSPYDGASVSLNAVVACAVAVHAGDLGEAREQAALALRVVDTTENIWHQAEVRLHVSALARTTGDRAEERRLLSEARDLFRAKEIAYWARWCEERLAELDRDTP